MDERFSRSARIFGMENQEKLNNAKVLVFGLGGVGGAVSEALARSGVGTLGLVDKDVVDITNINRQLIATENTIGIKKTDACEKRLVEINPLVITKQKEVIALDAKINFDDNALFRHEDILLLKDEKEENPLELEAQKNGLSYIKLDGTIGCMVNGAGLAMATMDVIKLAGKNAANFLDVGGGASSEKIEKAFKLLISDENLEAVFINIFGGILRCDFLAEVKYLRYFFHQTGIRQW